MAELATLFFLGPFYFFYFLIFPGLFQVPLEEMLVSGLGTAVWLLFLGAIGRLFS